MSKDATSSLAPHIAILLCAHDGARFIQQQLQSLVLQTHQNISLWISLDNPAPNRDTKKLFDIIDDFQNTHAAHFPITIMPGPNNGFLSNFFSLLCNENIQADYFAYCDQDDIWEPNKIERALSFLEAYDPCKPTLYCSRTALIDATGKPIGFSPLFNKTPSFKNALIQNIGGGNTMIFNKTTRDMLKHIGPQDIASHDWWTYLLVTGANGHVVYDPVPSILYRQHEKNLVGANTGWAARLKRAVQLLKGRFRRWNDIHATALEKSQNYLTPENQKIFKNFQKARNKSLFFSRINAIRKLGVYRQTRLGNIGLYVAALLKKL